MGGGLVRGQQVSVDLKSKQRPVRKFSTSCSCCLLPPPGPTVVLRRQIRSQPERPLRLRRSRRKQRQVVTVRARGWKCQKNLRALHVHLGCWELGNTQPQGPEEVRAWPGPEEDSP